jgi:NADH-quinone oxidoreductase subunit A
MDGWLGVVIMIGLGLAFAATMIGLSALLGNARERHSVKFYLVAMIFLLFDIEIAFLYPWALAFRSLGWAGFFQIVTFFLILLVGYVYVWRKGALDWGPAVRKPRVQTRKVA